MEPEHLLQRVTGCIPFDVDDVDSHRGRRSMGMKNPGTPER